MADPLEGQVLKSSSEAWSRDLGKWCLSLNGPFLKPTSKSRPADS